MNETSLPVKPDRIERNEIRTYYNKAGAALVIFCGLYLILKTFFGFIDKSAIDPALLELFNMILVVIIEIAAIAGGSYFTGLDWRDFFRNRKGYNGATVFKAYVTTQGLGYIGIFIGVAFVFLMRILGGNTDFPLVTQGNTPLSTAIVAFQVVICAPILEEILCRGLVLNGLKKYNTFLALVVSSLMFGMIHGNVFQFSYATIMGFVLGVVALKSNSIIPTIFAHMSVNSTAMILQILYGVTGINDYSVAIGDVDPTDIEAVTAVSLGMPASVIIFVNLLMIFLLTMVISAIIIAALHVRKFRNYCPRSTPLGKSRGWAVFFTSPVWIILIVYHIFNVFVLPFLMSA